MIDIDSHKAEVRQLLADDDTPALVLMSIILTLFGDRVFGDGQDIDQMDPLEIWEGLEQVTGIRISPEQENKVQALHLAMSGEGFYDSPEIFASVCAALYDGDLGDMINGVFDPPSVIEVMWGIMEVELARDDEQGPPEFSAAVSRLIEEIAASEAYDLEIFQVEVMAAFADMKDRLRLLGVTEQELVLLDREYEETENATEDIMATPVN